jgi:hypothetical protein
MLRAMPRATRRVVPFLIAVSSAACQAKDSEPTKAAATAAPDRPAEAPDGPWRLASFPNGGALVADRAHCTVSRVHDGTKWSRTVAPCDDTLEIAVALDSTAIVRTASTLFGFDLEGAEVFRVALSGRAPRPLAAPAVTRDSLAVVALGSQLVVAYRKGQEVWRSVLPASEALVTSPVGSQTEGVLLSSGAGVTALGADGSLRWKKPSAAAAK